MSEWDRILAEVAEDETWLTLAERRGSISTVGEKDMPAYAKSQYELFRGLAEKFGYLSN